MKMLKKRDSPGDSDRGGVRGRRTSSLTRMSRNGINPFRPPVKVPVSADTRGAGAEGIRIIELEEARRVVESGASVIDARRKEEYDGGAYSGRHPVSTITIWERTGTSVLPRLSNEREIMVYCSEMGCDDSELLAKELYRLGFTKLLVFKGGFAEWSGAGLPVERGDL